MAQKILDTLARYAVFSKVELVRDETITSVLGIIGANENDIPAIDLPMATNAITPIQDAVLINVDENADESASRLELWSSNAHPLA